MAITNISKKRVISENAKILENAVSRAIGLMFSKRTGNALIFMFKEEKTIALHMLFVFYPIDVLFLDRKKIVVDKKEDFKPFTFYASKKKALYVIEMANGMIRKTKTGIGDKIGF